MELTGRTAAEIFDCVRLQAQAGQLAPGQSLPPLRELATALGLNRNTVAAAYRRLTSAGITESNGRLGTVIRPQNKIREQEGALADTPLLDLASGNPARRWLPNLAEVLARQDGPPPLYGAATVHAGLAATARAWLQPDCPSAQHIEVTHGAVDAIERLLEAHLVADDKVVVEEPCFITSINTLHVAGLQAVGVPVDAEGMRADALEQALAAGARAVIITPRAHNPTGCNLSPKRALALRRVLARYPHVLIIIDDHFALLAHAPYYSVLSATSARWALVRSVSKALGPDLRLAVLACDEQTAQRLQARLAPGTQWVSHLLQGIAHTCLVDPAIRARIAAAGADYAQRRATLLAALRAQKIAVSQQADGLNLWLPLAQDSAPVAHALARSGWLVRSGEAFSVRQSIQGLRISVADLDAAAAQKLALDLRRCLA
ncbi:MocR-like B6 salvage transcription factor PtsJ [Amantichitinum ursilacus]|uniref:Putative 8-amino-7-oxononanoate synthase n=1 Tax=Amantichitinum ursilacus TaxID=857265 RepID=A0A0N1JTI7_9NEIS|nr:transcriptional regulator PtsJ [Amantichitinum ursilacus]KPC54694.1 putative HTH-type transcriptional regulator YdcR [Amantichitinum ursilacus]